MSTRAIGAAVLADDDAPDAWAQLRRALRALLRRQLIVRTELARGHVYALAPARPEPEPKRRALPRGSRGVDEVLRLWFGASG